MRDWHTFSYRLAPNDDSLKTLCIPVSITAFDKIVSQEIFLVKFHCYLLHRDITAEPIKKDFQI